MVPGHDISNAENIKVNVSTKHRVVTVQYHNHNILNHNSQIKMWTD